MRRKLSALLSIWIILAVMLAGAASAATPADYDAANPQLLATDHLYSQAAVLLDADSGDILFSKNENVRMHPASTTKIMTVLLAIESGYPLDQQIAIPQAAADIPRDSSIIPVYPGETMTFGDLLKGVILHSGNDGANAVAVLVAGSIENFAEKMNQRAAEIGCTNTHFVNPHGYTDENHYTTAYDMALIAREAMRNATFRQIVGSPTATIVVNERGELKLVSKHEIMKESSPFYYDGCIGVKTGTTSAAGECFVGAAEKDGAMLISVVFKSEKTEKEEYRWLDTAKLFDFGWTCYDAYTLDQMYSVARDQIASFVISNASEDDPNGGRLDLEIAQISNTDYLRMVERDNPNALVNAVDDFISRTKVEITHDLTAPISMGEIIGDFSYYDATTGSTVTAKLVAGRDVAQMVVHESIFDFFPFLRIFGNKLFLALLAVLVLLVILIILLAASRRAARQRRRRKIYEQRRAEYMRRERIQGADRYNGSRSPSGSVRRPRSTTPARTQSRVDSRDNRRSRGSAPVRRDNRRPR